MTKCRYCGRQAHVAHLCANCRKYYCLEHRDPKMHDCPSQKRPDATESQPTRTVTRTITPRNNKEKKKLLTIHFTFLEDKKQSNKEQKPVYTEVLEPQSLSSTNRRVAASFEAGEIQRENLARARYTEKLRPPPVMEEAARATSYPAVFESVSRKLFAVSFILVLAEEVLRLVSYISNPHFLAYLDGNLYVKILNESMDPYVASLIVFILVCSILFITAKLASTNPNASTSRFSLLKHAVPFGIYIAVSITYVVSMTNWFFILKS